MGALGGNLGEACGAGDGLWLWKRLIIVTGGVASEIVSGLVAGTLVV